MCSLFTFPRFPKAILLLFLACFFMIQTGSLYAQQSAADEMETLLATPAVTYGQAARFVLEASDEAVLSHTDEAFTYAAEKNWLPKNVSADTEARLDGIAKLIMHSFQLKGGIMYSLTKNPHFAYRELAYKKMIQGRIDPAMKTPGSLLLFMVARVLSQTEIENIPSYAVTQEEVPADEKTEHQEALVFEISEQLKEMAISDVDVRIIDEGVTISLSNIQFLANSAVLPDFEMAKLDNIARILSSITARNILVGGHTAMAGTEQDRLETSWERAQSVAFYLISTGVRNPSEVSIIGYGAERPLSADNMAENRRVEITILE